MESMMTGRRWTITLTALLLGAADVAHAWGQRAHGAIGVLAVERLSEPARSGVAELLGSTDLDEVVGACYWPDLWRGMGDGADTAPWHYVNIAPENRAYQASRDCPDGQCVTAQVNRHAAVLADRSKSREERRLAFKYLCHFAADLHQPLHVGYADDRGGNLVTIRYQGREMNLHRYWDSGLLDRQVGTLAELLALLRDRPNPSPESWSPADTIAWTNESFSLTRNFAYPPTHTVDEAWEARSWQVTQQQLDVASGRLAAILEWVLGGTGDAGEAP